MTSDGLVHCIGLSLLKVAAQIKYSLRLHSRPAPLWRPFNPLFFLELSFARRAEMILVVWCSEFSWSHRPIDVIDAIKKHLKSFPWFYLHLRSCLHLTAPPLWRSRETVKSTASSTWYDFLKHKKVCFPRLSRCQFKSDICRTYI